ncbi:MAG: sulfate transporter [Tistrella sp.]|uniref:DUF3164 family protein n=1 Tax=Tistrella sp. TaxID=2024861 RepID=UPI000C357AD0|nr:DUF3164 family protein [Tistrella sp.]MAD39556.1 sulfate transporter [Tistrella sp.]MBA74901.1 sulfate transporter [Tistrella sp.]|tara:strand:- start:490 stop:1164 length:675 start_codon:yes stop_codon:yes gene_type:complete
MDTNTDARITSFSPAPVPDGRVLFEGREYLRDGRGGMRAIEAIRPQDLLQDQLVRSEFGWALALADQVRRFKGHAYENLGAFDALLAEKYGLTKGGGKGNRTYATYDGLMQIEVRVHDRIVFGPEMQVAKGLMDECLNEWAQDTKAELRSLITRAFETDKEGSINRTHVFSLLQIESDDPRFIRGQQAIRDAIRVVGARQYIRYRMRESPDAPWTTVTIDLANA